MRFWKPDHFTCFPAPNPPNWVVSLGLKYQEKQVTSQETQSSFLSLPRPVPPQETLLPQHPARGSGMYHHRGTREKSKLGEKIPSKGQLDPEEVIRLELE